MDLPRQFSYDPNWRLISVVLAAGAGVLALVAIQGEYSRPGIALGGALIILALLPVVRRLAFKRFVVLGPTALTLPTGLLHSHMVEIPYSDITRAWENHLPLTTVLCIVTEARRYNILSTLLPDPQSYLDLRGFIFNQWMEQQALIGEAAEAELDEARRELERALLESKTSPEPDEKESLKPVEMPAWMPMAQGEKADLQQTVEMFETITQAEPLDYQSLEILKEAYSKLGRQMDAVRTWKRIAEAYVELGRVSSAITEYKAILAKYPYDLDVQKALDKIEGKVK
jgi:tetratricopeptide (TPR) repeat protein